MKKRGFCETKFRSMLFSGTLTMAVIYFMMLCDTIIAGYFIGETGVAAINAVFPVTGIITFLSTFISIGTGILYSRAIGAMKKRRADEIFGQGLILNIAIGALGALALLLFEDSYFRIIGVTGEIYELASSYYRLTPVNAVLAVLVAYLTELVYTDGDEAVNNISYALQIGGNIVFSILLARAYGMPGIILGTVLGNLLGLLSVLVHFFRKNNTLRFVWHFSLRDLAESIRFSIVDASIYICWAVADYLLIAFVSARYGETELVTLAVAESLIEFALVLDGVGMAMQPLIGTYFGEKNHVLIRRLMKDATKAALLEGAIANLLVFLFAKQFCALFGVTGGAALTSCIHAVRIVSLGMIFSSAVALMTSYYMLIDHVALSVLITVLKDGVLYSFFPILCAFLWGIDGMWAAFVLSPLLTLVLSFCFIRLRFGKKRFPYLLESDTQILIFEDTLTKESCASLSRQVQNALKKNGFSAETANMAALFTEEIGLTVLEKNSSRKKRILTEISLIFEDTSVLLIERDSGEIFDLTDPDQRIEGLSGFVLSGLMESHREKSYLITTGYNRNMIRFGKQE